MRLKELIREKYEGTGFTKDMKKSLGKKELNYILTDELNASFKNLFKDIDPSIFVLFGKKTKENYIDYFDPKTVNKTIQGLNKKISKDSIILVVDYEDILSPEVILEKMFNIIFHHEKFKDIEDEFTRVISNALFKKLHMLHRYVNLTREQIIQILTLVFYRDVISVQNMIVSVSTELLYNGSVSVSSLSKPIEEIVINSVKNSKTTMKDTVLSSIEGIGDYIIKGYEDYVAYAQHPSGAFRYRLVSIFDDLKGTAIYI